MAWVNNARLGVILRTKKRGTVRVAVLERHLCCCSTKVIQGEAAFRQRRRMQSGLSAPVPRSMTPNVAVERR